MFIRISFHVSTSIIYPRRFFSIHPVCLSDIQALFYRYINLKPENKFNDQLKTRKQTVGKMRDEYESDIGINIVVCYTQFMDFCTLIFS